MIYRDWFMDCEAGPVCLLEGESWQDMYCEVCDFRYTYLGCYSLYRESIMEVMIKVADMVEPGEHAEYEYQVVRMLDHIQEEVEKELLQNS